MTRAIGLALLYGSAVLGIAAPVLYAVLHPGWRRTPEGKHLMLYMGVVALVLSVWSVGALFKAPEWWDHVRLIAFALLPFVLGWRVWLIVRTYREDR